MKITNDLINENSNKNAKIIFAFIIALCAILVISITVTAIIFFMPKTIRIEAGEDPNLDAIFKTEDYDTSDDFNPDCINHPGKYKFTISYGNRSKKITLIVTDTKAPEVKLHDRIYVSSTDIIPTVEDFIDTIYEADSYTGEILMDMTYNFKMGQSYGIEIQFKDPSGNKTEVLQSVLSYIFDEEAPTITLPSTIYFEIGGAKAYRQHIKTTDNCIGKIALEVDDSGVNYDKEGTYVVKVTATDVAGNKATAETNVQIIPSSEDTSIDELNRKIAAIANSIINPNMSTEEKCRAIYTYVQSNIKYVSTSVGEGYIEVAFNALETKRGDCYSFYSITKAFLDYLGIENMQIQRTAGKGEGTHYWNYVNIGTKTHPEWYHLDTTELVYNYNVSGCLLTTKQLEAYDRWREGVYFRHFDKSLVPASATKIITPIPELENYMK